MPQSQLNAPEFPEGMQWLNTDRPLRLRELRGKVVLLDFWTYCCINCMHVLADLKRLEQKYPDELVVIGVHSAKFTAERESENIRQAILRYGVSHPVVNDRDLTIWRRYGVSAWPTLVLIDPDGKIAGAHSGEGVFEPFDRAIAGLIREFAAKGRLDRSKKGEPGAGRTPLALGLESRQAAQTVLSFPGKVLADEAGGRLFVADSGHNRIIVVALADGAVRQLIGSGEIGMDDGAFDRATFNHPQGIALAGDVLYIADTENHAIRAADLARRTVTTSAGIPPGGRDQARESNVPGRGPATALNSPWDLLHREGTLYIAMAGSHQLWRMDLKSGWVQPHAGSGREARSDGPLAQAALAQPSGIATDGVKLYFADSECSSVRAAAIDPAGRVETLVGGDLFDFGDRDGTGLDVRLQHPLGVAWHQGVLYVADSYNHKIKRVFPATRRCETFLGTGKAGLRDGAEAEFYEPGGLSAAGGKLYIADTNNHVIRVADLNTRQVGTVSIKGLEVPRPRAEAKYEGEVVALPAQTAAPGELQVTVALELPKGYKLTPDAPTAVVLRSSKKEVLRFGPSTLPGTASAPSRAETERSVPVRSFPVTVAAQAAEGEAELQADLDIYYCSEGRESLCFYHQARLTALVRVQAGAAGRPLELRYRLTPRSR